MTLRQKLLLLGGGGILPAVFIGIAGYRAVAEMELDTRDILTASFSLRNHWEGDMMHEGLRADVYAALADKTDEEKAKSRADLEKDAERFRQAVARNRQLKLGREMQSALAELAPRLEDYIRQAEIIVDLAGKDRSAAMSQIPHFQQAFEALDTSQEKVSDLMLKKSEEVAMEGEGDSRASKHLMLLSLAASLFILVTVAWLLARSISRRFYVGLRSVAEGSQQVAAAASQISGGSQSLAQSASRQAASLEETSASAEEIRAITKKNAGNSLMAARKTEETVQEVEQASQALSSLLLSMQQIVDSAAKIAGIIKVIEEIAFQTNILALNAAVEAARAGDAGMGFAVVADEVRNLAHRSAEAAKNTASLIEEAIGRTQTGKEQLDNLAALMKTVAENTAKVKTLSDDVNAGSSEQATDIEGIVRSVVQMQTITQQVAANAEEHAAAAEQLTSQTASVDSALASLVSLVGESDSLSKRS